MGTGKESLKTSSTSLPHSSIQCTFSITKSKTLVKSIAVHKCSSPVIWYLQSLDSVFLSNLKFHWKQSEQFIIHIYKTFAFTRDGQRWDFRPSGHSSVLHFLVGLRESQDHIGNRMHLIIYDQPPSQPSSRSYSDSLQGWRWAGRWQSLRCSPSPPTPTGTSSSCPPPPGCNQIKFDGQLPMAWLDQKCPRFYQKSKTGFDLFAKKVLTCPGCHSGLAVSSSDALNSHSWVEANVVFFDFTKMF